MNTSFEVGAVFKILDQASPALRKIMAEVRALNKVVQEARANLVKLSQGVPGMRNAAGEATALAGAWKGVVTQTNAAVKSMQNVQKAALAAAQSAGAVTAAAARSAGANVANAVTAGGRGRHRSPLHVSGYSAPLGGGSHVRLYGGNNAMMAGVGLLGYGAYEEAQMQDAIFQLMYHTGQKSTPENRKRLRDIIQQSTAQSGFSLHEVTEAAKTQARMFVGTPGGGMEVLPEMLKAAAAEARLKGSGLAESMNAFIGLAHMTQQYSPEAIKKLAPAFAFISASNPDRLAGIERSASYSVPLLQSGLGIDPIDTLLAGTVMRRAGATSSKSGTWLREMMQRSMPGSSFDTKKNYYKHLKLLQAAGLADAHGKPTNFIDGKPSLIATMDTLGENLPKMNVAERKGLMKYLFGERGSGAAALLSNESARQQFHELRKEMNDPARINRYNTFMEDYNENSPVQKFRTTMADFKNVLMDIGQTVLPGVTGALQDFDNALKALKSWLPGGGDKASGDKWKVGTRALEGMAGGALTGGAIGMFGGPIGWAGGTAIGGIVGGLYGVTEGYFNKLAEPVNKFGKEAGAAGNAAGALAESTKSFGDSIRSLGSALYGITAGAGMQPMNYLGGPSKTLKAAPITLALNIDGRTLAQSISQQLEYLYEHATGAPSYDGSRKFIPSDGGIVGT